jgi:membrane-associated phospholipid phosphatase
MFGLLDRPRRVAPLSRSPRLWGARRSPLQRAHAWLLLGLWLGSVSSVHAQQVTDRAEPRGDAVSWNPAWPTFQTGEWVATGVGIATLLGSRLAPQRTTHWQGGILYDDLGRSAFRVGGASGRRQARDASDILLAVNESWPYFDAFVVAAWYRQSPDVAWQQGLITAEVLAVTAGMQSLVSAFVSRERPYGRRCGDAAFPEDSRDCKSSDRFLSFYSGHTSQAFASAAVQCMHHAYVPLYGGGAADDWACVGAMGIAATTAALRMATDVHYATDVTAGALMGTATGLLLPWLLHYRHGAPAALESSSWRLTVVPTGLGATGVLVF